MPLLRRHHLNTAIYIGSALLNRGASIILIPLYTRQLSREQYGAYGLCQSCLAIAPPLISLALISAISRFYFDEQDPQKRDTTVGSLALAMLALVFSAGLLGELWLDFVGGPHFGGLTTNQLRLLLWASALTPLSDIPVVYFRASEQAFRSTLLSLGLFAATATSTMYFMLVRKWGLSGLLSGVLVGQSVGALFTLTFVLAALRPSWNVSLIRAALRFSVPFLPHMLGTALMVGVDRWALEYYHLRDQLGLFTLAAQLTMPIPIATGAWNEASSPRFMAAFRDGGYPAARAAHPRVVAGFALFGFGALLCIMAGFPILKLLVGARFSAAFSIVPWVGLNLVIAAFFSASVNAIALTKQTRIIPALTIAAVVVNFVLNFSLVPAFGLYGALLASGLAFGFRSAIMHFVAVRLLRR